MVRARSEPPLAAADDVPGNARRVRFGIFEADLHEHRLTRSGREVAIQEQPFRLLSLLIERAGELVTREEIRSAIWPDGTTVDFERGMNTAVNKLRTALRDSAESPRFIETVPRLGYRFLAPVEVTPDEQARAVSARATPGIDRNRAALVLSVLVLATALLAIAATRWFDRNSGGAGQTRSSLAVLPFVNLSGDPAQGFFSAGLTEEMTSRLGRLAPAQLAVIARTTMMAYSNPEQSIAEIAEELGVDYFLEGSVRRSGERVRINAQLIRASDQTHLWSEDYDSKVEDILAVQTQVAQRVARSLAVEVLEPPKRSAAVDPAAYDAYLRGLHFRDMLSEEGYRKAIRSFEEALSHDPDFAPAYAAMSACYCLLGGHGLEVADPATLLGRTREFANRALELDQTLADAQGALGMAYFKHDWDWSRAEETLRRATEMNPSYPMARIWYSFLLGSQGRHAEALSQVDDAKRSDPFSRVVNANWAWQRYEARRYDEAIQKFGETLELFPGFWIAHWGRGLSHLQLGTREAAIEDLRRAVELSKADSAAMGALAFAYATLGEEEQARRLLDGLLARARDAYVAPVIFVGIYGALGETDSAFEWLERAHQARSRSMAWLRVAHEFDPLRDDPRFASMLRRMNLAP